MANENRDMNPDPITGKPGSHPLGTGVGATGGALAGAAIGAPAGPVGMAAGAAIGAAVGGATGAVVASQGTEHLKLPAETRLQFQLTAAVTVQP